MTFIIHPHVRNPAYIHIPNESTQQLRVCLKSLQHYSNARTQMYERVHTEPRWRIWTVAYYCLNLYVISYTLLVAE